MEPDQLLEMRSRIASLVPFRRNPRPSQPDSLPVHLDRELARLGETTAAIVRALKDLDARLRWLEDDVR